MIEGNIHCPVCKQVRSPQFQGQRLLCKCDDCGINFAVQEKGKGVIVFQEKVLTSAPVYVK